MRKIVLSPFLLLLVTLFIFSKQPVIPPAKKDTRPNIIIILADDLGFSDVGCFGSEIHTPNIDYLAANGLRFTQFYNTSRCCPTRASLLTGLYNHQAGIGEMTAARAEPGYRGFITDSTVTIAEVLKGAGYHTAMCGKWHVSNTVEQSTPQAQLRWLNHQETHPYFSPIEQYPASRGFERYFGTLWGVVDYFDPFSLVSGTTPINSVPANYYHTDAINDTAAAYIQEMSKEDKPFFLYIAENAPHWPLQALPEDIDKYKDTYKVGWDAVRQQRYEKQAKLGITDSNKAKLYERINSSESWADNPHKEWDAHAMAVHAAMIDRMDKGIGRIIDALRKTGELDNTVIFFLSDNGASPEVCAAYGPGFDRPGETRKGEAIKYDTKKETMPGPETTYTSIGPVWANVANTPYRFAKEDSYEGGVHTPMIAFWPQGITVKKGTLVNHVGHVMDFMATCIELANAHYPEQYNKHTIKPLQGISFASVLKGHQAKEHLILFNEHYGAKYARFEHWKLVARKQDNWHLYDIDKDQTEINDLSAIHTDVVKRLDSMWQNWADGNRVFPKPGRK